MRIWRCKKQLKKKKSTLGKEVFYSTARKLILQAQDMLWVEHLEIMDYMRSSVNLRAYGQRDPLIEYRKEGLRLFHEMGESVSETILRMLPNIGAGAFSREEQKLKTIHKNASLIGGTKPDSKVTVSTTGSVGQSNDVKKVGRNDPCPCGSGKKYKKCHGA